jgi:hypothetical protein
MSVNIPQELDTMAALTALVEQSPSAQRQPREDLPATTQVIPDKDYSGPQRQDGATIADRDPLFVSPAPPAKDSAGASVPSPIPQGGGLLAPAPVAGGTTAPDNGVAGFPAVTNNNRLFFTGRTGVGKDWLAGQVKAKVMSATSPLLQAARDRFPAAKPEHFQTLLPTIHAWGEGVVDKNFPLTPARWIFIEHMAGLWPAFGTPGFWMKLLLETVGGTEGKIAVTNVTTAADFAALKAAGFTHFHVMTSPAAYMQRQKRQGADDRLATALDQDAIKKVSAQRAGDKLPVIWNAPEAPPSPRIWTVTEFLQSMDSAPAAESFAAFE